MIKCAAAKSIGRSHVQTGMHCQDAVKTRNLRNKACISLADGAGSKRYSRTGANTVAMLSTHEFLDDFDRIYADIQGRNEILAHEIIKKFNFVIEGKARRRRCTISDYASTLLFFACDKNKYIAGHIGDGVIIARFGKELVTLSEPRNGEYANTTYFITDADASHHLRLYAGEFDGDLGVLLMSDGAAESLYDKSTGRAGSGAIRLLDVFSNLSSAKMRRVLQDNLDHVISKKTPDDCSIAALVVAP